MNITFNFVKVLKPLMFKSKVRGRPVKIARKILLKFPIFTGFLTGLTDIIRALVCVLCTANGLWSVRSLLIPLNLSAF